MSFKLAAFLFHLSAFVVPSLRCQSTFPDVGEDAAAARSHKEGRTFGFWNHGHNGFALPPPPPLPFRDFDQEASFSGINYNVDPLLPFPVGPKESATDLEFNRDYIDGSPNVPFDYSSENGRQFPFYFPFPSFPFQQPPVFNFPQFTPWWQGDNVCVVKDELTEDWTGNEVGVGAQPDFSINVQSCAEQHNKYICRTITNRAGKKFTTISTRECCRGYARFPQRQGPNAACVKVEMVSFNEAVKKYGYPEFSVSLKKANISEDVIKMATLLLPLKFKQERPTNSSAEADDSISDATEVNSISVDDIYEYIIPNKTIDLETIENEAVVKTENDHVIRFNVYPRSNVNVNESDYEFLYHYTANCVPILKPKIFAMEGMVLGLKSELLVAEQSLMELLRDRDDLSMFRQMVENFNLTEFLEEKDAVTILAPLDDAFSDMSPIEQRMLRGGDKCAEEYVTNHILGLTLCSSAIVKNAKAHVNNLLKYPLTFERSSGDIIVNQHSKLIELDKVATNGVLHVLDKTLPSDASMTVSSLLEKRNSSIFAQLMMNSGYAEEIEDLRGVTLFVPTDRAMKNSIWKAELDKNSTSLIRNHTLHQFLTNHIVDGVVGSHDFRTGFITSMTNLSLKMNLITNRGGATVNCARFVTTDGVSCNRAIHQIDRTMDIPTTSLLAAIEANENYSKFLNLLKRANLTNLINDAQDVTVLVPANDVFEEQAEFYNELIESKLDLELFLKAHIIMNAVCCSSFPKYPLVNSVQSLSGLSLVVTKQRRPTIANAHITKCDLIQKNGIIFEVNDIIEFKQPAARQPFF